MGEFFHGWRRKVGLMTLAMACMLSAGWVRSFSKADGVNSHTWQFISHHGGVFCEIIPNRFDFIFSCYSTDEEMMRNAYSHSSLKHIWHWKRLGFAYGTTDGEFKNGDGTTSQVMLVSFYLPYWSIVIPLTLTSLWLLLRIPFKPDANFDASAKPA